MKSIFYPSIIAESIYDIDINELYNNGIRGLIFDIDNTLVGHGVLDVDDKLLNWIKDLKNMGFNICIVSNNKEYRVTKFNEKINVLTIYKASKPRKRAFLKASEMMNIDINKIAVVGDQIFTDILGGNRLGMYTIMVKPVGKEEPWFIKTKRILEKIVLKKMR